jgi:hypothetical protein
MKIDKVLFGCNADPMYYDFWNVNSMLFQEKFGIEPVLCFCGEIKHEYGIKSRHGHVIEFPLVEGVPEYLQATWVRFYAASLFPNEVCLLGDIDMLPISRNFYLRNIETISNDTYVHLYADAYNVGNFRHWKQPILDNTVPAHHHVGKGRLFKEIYQLEETWEKEARAFADGIGGVTHPEHPGWKHWCRDEVHPTFMMRGYIKRLGSSKIYTPSYSQVLLSRPDVDYTQEDLESDKFFACHSPRPYKTHKKWIDDLISKI